MNESRLLDYLEHVAEAARQACSYVEGMEKPAFLADTRTQQAVILNVVIIGEAATRLLQGYETFLERHPQIPWRSMKGMRNRMAHGYSTSTWTWSGKRCRPPCPNCSNNSRPPSRTRKHGCRASPTPIEVIASSLMT